MRTINMRYGERIPFMGMRVYLHTTYEGAGMYEQDALSSEIIGIAQRLGIVDRDARLDQKQVLMLAEAIKVKIKSAATELKQATDLNSELLSALQMGYELSAFTGSITLRMATDDSVATILTELRNRIDQFQQAAFPVLERVRAAELLTTPTPGAPSNT